MSLSNDRYITIGEITKFLGIKRHTLHRWLKEHNIKCLTVDAGNRRTTLVWKPDFDRFVAEHTVRHEPTIEKRRPGRPSKLKVAGAND